jgi:hypothetical protein
MSNPILFRTFPIFFIHYDLIHSEQDATRSGAYISSVRDQKSLEGKVIRLDLKKNKKNGNIRSVTPESCE